RGVGEAAARRVQGPAHDRLRGRAASRPERQALQAEAPRPVLGGEGPGDMTGGAGLAPAEPVVATHVVDSPYPRRRGAAIRRFAEACERSAVPTGVPVRSRWREEPQGLITDIECFDPEGGDEPRPTPEGGPGPVAGDAGRGQAPTSVDGITSPVRLEYRYTP